jgi:hypothetical protein
MFRVVVVGLVTLTGLAAGLCIGLLVGAAIVEFGSRSCSGAACGDLIVRGIVPVAGLAGALIGLAKGMNLVTTRRIRA